MPAIHILGNLILIALAGALGWYLSRRKKRALIGIGLAGICCGLSVSLAVRPDLVLALVPYQDLTFYSNLYPFTFALFVPCAFQCVKTRGQKQRMAVMCGVLFILSFMPSDYHFRALAHSPATVFDEDGLCRQTSDYTCSAASLVTYLGLFDVEITEAQAIDLALTKKGYGTTSLGLYRALSLKTKEVDVAMEQAGRVGSPVPTIDHVTVDEFLNRDTPAIVLVGLPQHGRTTAAAAFGRDNNWPLGIYHDVVFMGKDPEDSDRILIADPDMGIESWPIDHFRFLFRGVAVRYVF